MDAQEVGKLRKQGKLEEAMTMAGELLTQDSENIWNKRAAAWVHYDLMKMNANPGGRETFMKHLKALRELNLPEDEDMVFNQLTYQVSKFLHSIPLDANHKQNLISLEEVWAEVRAFPIKRPSKEYSIILSSFHRFNKGWYGYTEFLKEWGLDNFMPVDYQAELFQDKKMLPLAEQVYSAYAKWVLKPGQVKREIGGLSVTVLTVPGSTLKDHPDLIPRMQNLLKNHPEYGYPRYFFSQLLMLGGKDRDEAWQVLRPFAIKKSNEFWIWELISEIREDQPELHIACLCKAITCGTSPEFLVKVQFELVKALVKQSYFNEAKIELLKNIAIRERNNWKVPFAVNQLKHEDWFATAQEAGDTARFLKENALLAEALLHEGIEEVAAILVHINSEKGTASFVADGDREGFFQPRKLISEPKIGSCFMVRLKPEGDKGFHKLLTARPISESPSGLTQSVTGALKMNRNADFGFVEGVFTDGALIKKNGLKDGDVVTIQAVRSFDRKKNAWGWRALK